MKPIITAVSYYFFLYFVWFRHTTLFTFCQMARPSGSILTSCTYTLLHDCCFVIGQSLQIQIINLSINNNYHILILLILTCCFTAIRRIFSIFRERSERCFSVNYIWIDQSRNSSRIAMYSMLICARAHPALSLGIQSTNYGLLTWHEYKNKLMIFFLRAHFSMSVFRFYFRRGSKI